MTARPAPFPFCRSDAPNKPDRFRDEFGRFWANGEPGGEYTLREAAEDRGDTLAQARAHLEREIAREDLLFAGPLPDDPDVELPLQWRRNRDYRDEHGEWCCLGWSTLDPDPDVRARLVSNPRIRMDPVPQNPGDRFLFFAMSTYEEAAAAQAWVEQRTGKAPPPPPRAQRKRSRPVPKRRRR